MRRLRFWTVFAIALFTLSLSTALLPLNGPLYGQSVPSQSIGVGGAVASVDAQATEIGIDILRRGGNAVDAAVATAAALGVTEPFSAGIGGGGFMLVYLKDGDRVITLDGREEAPASASVDMFQDPNSPDGENLPFFPNRITNGAAVGVPGTLLTWQQALSRYGTLTLREALQPAIRLAETGFTVDQTFADQIAENQERFSAFTSTQALYLPDGQPPQIGSQFRNPDLAQTYRLIAQQGPNVLHRGELAQAVVETVQTPPTVAEPPFPIFPGGMTLADLDRYEVQVRPAIASTYRGYQLCGMGLPSSGGITVAQTLNLLEGFDLSPEQPVQTLHNLIEAERLAYADRGGYLGDPEYVDVPLVGLLDADYAAQRRALLPETASAEDFIAEPGNPLPFQQDPSPSLTIFHKPAPTLDGEGPSTTHLTVADAVGNVVSYTLTIESTGGSGIVVPGYGFLLNNELTDFDATSPHPNAPEPGKRPRSSMAPTIAFGPEGQVLAFGSPGGSTIITTVLGLIVNQIDLGMTLPDAIAAPRISQRNSGSTRVDGGFETTVVGQALTELGHSLSPGDEIGAATGLVIQPDGTLLAAAEPMRRGGGAALTVRPIE